MNGLAVLAEKLALRVGGSREFKELSGALFPRLLKRWAEDVPWRRMVARPISRAMGKSAADKVTLSLAPPLADALSDTEIVRLLADNIPFLANTAADGVSQFLAALSELPAEEKERLVGKVLSGLDYASVGEMLTTLARMVNDVHEKNPTFLSDRLIPALTAVIEKTDFGELDDFYFKSVKDIAALASALTDVLMRYPAKMVCLLGLLPGIANLLVAVANQSLGKANTLAADLIAELSLSLVNDVDGKAVGQLANEIFELIRKVHTGSALLGPPGRPELTTLLTKKLAETGSALDPGLLWKARRAITELKEARLAARTTLLRENPELFRERLREQPGMANAKIRAFRKSAELADELPDDFLGEAVEEGFRQIDAKSIADTVNVICRVANRVRDEKPRFLTDLVYQFTNAADHLEISKTVRWLMEDLETAAKPIGRAVTAPVIVGFTRMCAPDDDEFGEDMENALTALQHLVSGAKEA